MTDAETDPLLEMFRAELREQTAVLSRGLLQLEAAPDILEPVDALVQAAHALRGAARIVHLDVPAHLAAGLEEWLVAVRDGQRRLTTDEIALCLRASDTLAALGEVEPAAWAESRAGDIAAIGEALNSPPFPAKPAEGTGMRAEPTLTPVPSPEKPGEVRKESSPLAPFVAMADPTLLELFREEVRSHATALNSGLLELEREPANPQRIEPLMRAAHSLKGAARIVGLDPAVQLAHELEDAFVAAQNGRVRLSSEDIDLLLRGADLLSELGESDLGEWATTRHGEVTQLRSAVAAITNGEAPKVAPASPQNRSYASPRRASTA